MQYNVVRGALQNYEVYWENEGSERLLGTASVDLPELEYLSSDLKGAGLLGEVALPIVGHFSSQSCTLHWRTIHGDLTKILAPITHHLTLRGAIQNYDAATGLMKVSAVKIVIYGVPKKSALGKFEPGEQTDSESEFEIVYLKIECDGEELVELDKMNAVFRVNGADYISDTREALAL